MSEFITFGGGAAGGYLLDEVPADLLHMLNAEVAEIRSGFDCSTPYNQFLAGHIEREFQITRSLPALEPFVVLNALLYNRRLDILKTFTPIFPGDRSALSLREVWVNFQRKYEFNPLHNHAGVFSFVIYLRIPYDLNDELGLAHGRRSRSSLSSCFQFVYGGLLGLEQHTLHLDKSYEGRMILFPARVNHQVYPFFTSDDYRISVAGNLYLATATEGPRDSTAAIPE